MPYYAVYGQIHVYLRNATICFKSAFLCIVFVCILCTEIDNWMLTGTYTHTRACINTDTYARTHTQTGTDSYSHVRTCTHRIHKQAFGVWLLTVVVFSLCSWNNTTSCMRRPMRGKQSVGWHVVKWWRESVQHGKLIGTLSQACTHSVAPPHHHPFPSSLSPLCLYPPPPVLPLSPSLCSPPPLVICFLNVKKATTTHSQTQAPKQYT